MAACLAYAMAEWSVVTMVEWSVDVRASVKAVQKAAR